MRPKTYDGPGAFQGGGHATIELANAAAIMYLNNRKYGEEARSETNEESAGEESESSDELALSPTDVSSRKRKAAEVAEARIQRLMQGVVSDWAGNDNWCHNYLKNRTDEDARDPQDWARIKALKIARLIGGPGSRNQGLPRARHPTDTPGEHAEIAATVAKPTAATEDSVVSPRASNRRSAVTYDSDATEADEFANDLPSDSDATEDDASIAPSTNARLLPGDERDDTVYVFDAAAKRGEEGYHALHHTPGAVATRVHAEGENRTRCDADEITASPVSDSHAATSTAVLTAAIPAEVLPTPAVPDAPPAAVARTRTLIRKRQHAAKSSGAGLRYNSRSAATALRPGNSVASALIIPDHAPNANQSPTSDGGRRKRGQKNSRDIGSCAGATKPQARGPAGNFQTIGGYQHGSRPAPPVHSPYRTPQPNVHTRSIQESEDTRVTQH